MASLPAQVALTGTTYSQNFNNLFNASANVYAWTDNSTVPGWYGTTVGATAPYYRSTNANMITPTSTTGQPTSLLALRSATATTDFALGSVGTAAYHAVFGAQFSNGTGSTITSLTIAYTGEQWGVNTGGATTLDFAYSSSASSLTSGTWTDVSALDFTSPLSGAGDGGGSGTNTGVDGNAAADRQTLTYTITGLSIAPGQTVWIRWTDDTTGGLGQALGVDDFSLTATLAVPEPPPAWAAAAGLAVLLLTRRRAALR